MRNSELPFTSVLSTSKEAAVTIGTTVERTRAPLDLLPLVALLLPPAGLVGLLVMHAVEMRMDDVDSGPGLVTVSDLSWLAAARAQSQRPASATAPVPANPLCVRRLA